jgi:hypothetical protein
MQVIDAIEAESEFRPRPGPLCRWCDYASICPEAPEAARAATLARPELTAHAPEPDDDYGRQLSLLGD